MGFFNFFSKEKKETLDKGLEKTKQGLFDKLKRAVAGRSKIDDDFLDNLEEVFITSDVGVETTLKIIDRLQKRAARDKYVSTSELNTLLRDEITEMLAENNNADTPDFSVPSDKKPYVIMVVGVNGVGKRLLSENLHTSSRRRATKSFWEPPTHSVRQPLNNCRYGANG